MTGSDDSGTFTIAKQGSITFFGDIVGRALRFLFVAVITRLVAQETYGVFTLSLSTILFIQAVASLNLFRSVDYFVPQYLQDGDESKAKGTVLSAVLIGGGAALVGAVVVATSAGQISVLFDEPELAIALPLIALLIPLETLKKTLVNLSHSIKKLQYRVLIKDIVEPTFRILLPAALVGLGMGLVGVIVGYLFATLLAVTVGAALFVWKLDWLRTSSSGSVQKSELLRYSLPLVFAGVSLSLVSQVDYFVIGYFMSSSDVAQYRVAWLLTANVLMVHMATGSIIKPMVAEEMENDSVIRSRFQLATRWASILTVPIAVTMMLAPGTYLSLLFTPEYAEAGLVVTVLCAGYLFNAMTGPKGMVLEGLGFTRLSLLNSIILLVFNSGINVLLVPRIGILGAAIGSATGMILMATAGVIEIFYARGIQPYSSNYFRIVIAIVPTVVLGRLLVTNVSETVVVAIALPVVLTVVYLLSIKLLRGFTDQDMMVAEAIDSRLGYRVVAPIIG